MSIDQVLSTIREQAALERDFIAPQSALRFEPFMGTHTLAVQLQGQDLRCNEVFLGQAQELAGIPKKYFDKCMATESDLAAYNLNRWFSRSQDNKLVRTFNSTDPERQIPTARALLSPSYDRTWGHAPIAAALQTAIADMKDVRFVSCEITDKKMYIKAVLPWLEGTIEKRDARKNDAFQSGFLLRNSETGHGRVEILPFIDILSCTNGMVFTDIGGITKVHRGRKETQTGELQVNYANDTIQAKRVALVGEIRDTLRTLCTMETVAQIKGVIEGVASTELTNPLGAVKALASSYELSVDESKAVEDAFLRGGDVTRWGLVQALTAASATVESYDRASELEALGAKIVSLPAESWKTLDIAA